MPFERRCRQSLYESADVPVAIIRNTGEGVIPSQEGGQKSEKASSFDDGWVRVTFLVAVEIADAEQEEGEIEGEEEGEEGDGGAEGEDEEEGGEDEPALWKRRMFSRRIDASDQERVRQTMRKKPNESKKLAVPPTFSIDAGIANPGVRTMPKAIQKPP